MYSIEVKKQYYRENKSRKGISKKIKKNGSRWGGNTWHSFAGLKITKQNKTSEPKGLYQGGRSSPH